MAQFSLEAPTVNLKQDAWYLGMNCQKEKERKEERERGRGSKNVWEQERGMCEIEKSYA